MNSIHPEKIFFGSTRVLSTQLEFSGAVGKMQWSVALPFWLIDTLLNALWTSARRNINSKRTYSISICLFAKLYEENVFKGEKKKEDVFLLHVCSSDPSSVKPIKNNMKYLKSAVVTFIGY